jgi:hypothetical protein
MFLDFIDRGIARAQAKREAAARARQQALLDKLSAERPDDQKLLQWLLDELQRLHVGAEEFMRGMSTKQRLRWNEDWLDLDCVASMVRNRIDARTGA